MVYGLAVRTRNARVVSSNPANVPIKTQLMRKAVGNHLINSTSLENTQILASGFCYARNRVCDNIYGKLSY